MGGCRSGLRRFVAASSHPARQWQGRPGHRTGRGVGGRWLARCACGFPDWPLRRPDSPPDRPCQIVDASGTVVAVTPDAFAVGVRVGMRRGEAEALAPAAVTLVADPGAEAVAFEPVALAIESVVPAMEMAAPGLVYLPTAGAVRYYRSEEAVMRRVVVAVHAIAPGGRFGLADGPVRGPDGGGPCRRRTADRHRHRGVSRRHRCRRRRGGGNWSPPSAGWGSAPSVVWRHCPGPRWPPGSDRPGWRRTVSPAGRTARCFPSHPG